MIPVLFTTGKKPNRAARAIARALSLAVPESALESRGKRTLASLISKARKRHFTRLCSVYCSQGKPSEIEFLAIADDGSWGRLAPKITVKTSSFAPKFPRAQSTCLTMSGAKAKSLSRLFSPKNHGADGEENGSRIVAGAKTLAVFMGKKKIASLGVSYEK